MRDYLHEKAVRSFSVPHEERLNLILASFSPLEKVVFGMLILISIVSALSILGQVNSSFTTTTPAPGGSIKEGLVGSPRFINPLLAISDADRDLTTLIYSGLMRATPEGELVHDLAESYEISEDGLEYRFTLREDVAFHDGTPVAADDVVFTISRAQDPAVRSPKRANWDGVTAKKINDREVLFILEQPYAPFLENTTLGILPSHVWRDVGVDQIPFSGFNTEPIGSGPYEVKSVERNRSGFPEAYELASFRGYALGEPYIRNISILFYSNEENLLEGYKRGEVESINSITPTSLSGERDARILKTPLPRIFAVFFNQNRASVFANKEVREALDAAVDKERIVNAVLGGYGSTIDGPLPPGILGAPASEEEKDNAETILIDAGWERNEEGIWEKETDEGVERLQFTLATSNVPELKAAGEIIERSWRGFGAEVTLQIFETGDLNQNVIRPRNYEALLFGEIIGRELDLFAFWHSSQRNDPGLNIALYTNITSDNLLERARVETDKQTRLELLEEFASEVKGDRPAVFLYSPDFIYIVPEKLKGLSLGSVTTPSERFINVYKWYIETEKVWNFFE